MITLHWTVGMECLYYNPDERKIINGTITALSGVTIGNRTATIKTDNDEKHTVSERCLCQTAAQANDQKIMHELQTHDNHTDTTKHLVKVINKMLQDPTTKISDKNYETLFDALDNMRSDTSSIEPKLVYFTNDFREYGQDAKSYGTNVFGVITIDGYPADETKSGQTICNIICTKTGDIIIVYQNNAYRLNPQVQELIGQSKIELLERFDDEKTTTYLAYMESFAVRDAQYAKTYMPDPWDDDNWLDNEETRIHIGLFNAKDNDSARKMAARFMNTVPENIGLIPTKVSTN